MSDRLPSEYGPVLPRNIEEYLALAMCRCELRNKFPTIDGFWMEVERVWRRYIPEARLCAPAEGGLTLWRKLPTHSLERT